ncbi:MAG: hypothetical protein KME25_15785 [Symplocastrum torsivum CPER-KK1]|jgi:alkaline phosphatase D|uniref:Uncharacterized protein n=1 Tax=Symplocastrum torsivum CPER-KK1 TaxID=450513 RepID=A0A951PNA2_9CYAN|nr:hypothetical protein [Symplocastrum torsivum CPER-KK1]
MERFHFERLLSTRLRRRSLLVSAGALTGIVLASQWPSRRVVAQPRFSDYPFKLGIASGDPLPDSKAQLNLLSTPDCLCWEFCLL